MLKDFCCGNILCASLEAFSAFIPEKMHIYSICLYQPHLSLSVCLFGVFGCVCGFFFFFNISLCCPDALRTAGNYHHISEMFFDCSENEFVFTTKEPALHVPLYFLLCRICQKFILENIPVYFALQGSSSGFLCSWEMALTAGLHPGPQS